MPAQPKHEIRAVWLTVNYGLDWPEKPFKTQYDIEKQKNDLDRMLDRLQHANINMVFFQTRLRGDVIYPSNIEPRSEYVKSINATADYDPLLYAIEACHRRGMECHSWIVVYPMGGDSRNRRLSRAFEEQKRSNIIKPFNRNYYLDPGNPETDIYILSLIREVVTGYDIDGVHLDYIRYPDNPDNFPDRDTYRQYGIGKDKNDWRRENVNRLVYSIYDTVKSLKPWVQVSSSVVGMYKEIQDLNRRHWTAYSTVYQDPVDWIEKGKHDFVVPMNYFSGVLFSSFVQDWVLRINERFVVPGLGVYKMDKKESGWKASVLLDQITFSRETKTHGNAYFRVAYLLDNSYSFGDELKMQFYRKLALLPPLTWLSQTIPNSPASISAYSKGSFLHLEWDKVEGNENQQLFYNIYRSEKFPVDTNQPENLVAARLQDNFYNIQIDNKIESGYYYVVTGYDRYHNESFYSSSVFFVTGDFEK